MGTSAAQIKGGKLKAARGFLRLALSRHSRDVPTMKELGFADFEVTTWYAIWAPRGTPKEAVDRMYQEVVKALQLPDMKRIWDDPGSYRRRPATGGDGRSLSRPRCRAGQGREGRRHQDRQLTTANTTYGGEP
jgi:hypothetical protein